MELTKGHKKKPKQYPVQVDKKMHEKIRHLAYQNKTNNK